MMMRRRGPGLIGVAARTAVVAGTASAVSGRVARRQQDKYAAQDQQAYDQQAAAPPVAPAASAAPDYAAELEQLAQLKQQGIVSEEEFEAKKKQILGL